MDLQLVGNPLARAAIPLAQPPIDLDRAVPLDPQKIDFTYYIDPFVQLLAKAGTCLLIATFYLAHYTYRTLTAARVIFSRILQAPDFNPHQVAFKEKIKRFEAQIPDLEDRLLNLELKFSQEHLIVRDLQELQKLNFEILETLRQLEYFTARLEGRAHPLPIQEQLVRVRNAYRELNLQMEHYCERKAGEIIHLSHDVVNTFTKGGIDLPDDISKDLLQMYKNLERVIGRVYRKISQEDYEKIKEISSRIQALEAGSFGKQRIGLAEPLRLKNIGNSCYMDSVLQALLCVNKVCEQFNQRLQPPERPVAPEDDHTPDYQNKLTQYQQDLLKYKKDTEEYAHKLKIQQEILQFINAQQLKGENGSYTQLELILFLTGGPDLKRLRKAIFESGFHYEFNMGRLTDQLDAASMMELFIDQFLTSYRFKWEEHAENKDFPGLEFIGPTEPVSLLQVPLRNKAHNQTVMKLLQFVIHKHPEREADPVYQRNFDPKDGVVINQDQADQSRLKPAKKVAEFYQSYRFKELPPILTLHFKRFKQAGKGGYVRPIKDDAPVRMPADGIIDLTKYYDAPDTEQKQARYKIKSYVVHSGSLHGGHYVAYVEKGGEYFYCNDTDPKFYRKITEKEFYSRQDAYLMVLERLPDEIPEENIVVDDAERNQG